MRKIVRKIKMANCNLFIINILPLSLWADYQQGRLSVTYTKSPFFSPVFARGFLYGEPSLQGLFLASTQMSNPEK